MARRLVACIAAALLLLVTMPAAARADSGVSAISIDAAVNGTPMGELVHLSPEQLTKIRVSVKNTTEEDLKVRSVRLSGSVLGLDFFVFDTGTLLSIPAGQSREWTMEIEIESLEGQATGLLPLTVAVIGPNQRVLGSVESTADVRGSIASTYGLFGLGVLVATVLLWATVLLALARRRLPANRALRALRFVPAGFGLGLTAIVGLSVLRVTAPTPTSELGYLAGLAAATFVLGYLTPTPMDPVKPGPLRVTAPAELTGPPSEGAPSESSGPPSWWQPQQQPSGPPPASTGGTVYRGGSYGSGPGNPHPSNPDPGNASERNRRR